LPGYITADYEIGEVEIETNKETIGELLFEIHMSNKVSYSEFPNDVSDPETVYKDLQKLNFLD
jgi:hypothetical protein